MPKTASTSDAIASIACAVGASPGKTPVIPASITAQLTRSFDRISRDALYVCPRAVDESNCELELSERQQS
ncbi:MAG: hypothetical protein ABIY55_19870 [Kofleriaceae bacterium]